MTSGLASSQDAASVELTEKPVGASAALNSALDLALEIDPKVLVFGEDVADPIGGVMKVTKGLSTKYSAHRVRSTPIAEQAIVGAAVGAALAGYRPVAEIMFFDFVAVAMDQIVNHAAKSRYMSGGHTPAPITIRTQIGTTRFGAQHSQSLEAWFMHTPGIKVVMPSGPADARGLLLSSIFDDDPVLFVENMATAFSPKEPVPIGDVRIPLGQAAVRRRGTDATVVTYGPDVATALAVAEELSGTVDLEVIDLRTLVPLDMPTVLESVAKTRRAVVLHSATQFAGPGAEIASQIHESLFGELEAPVRRLGGVFTPIPYAIELESRPTADSLRAAIADLMQRTR